MDRSLSKEEQGIATPKNPKLQKRFNLKSTNDRAETKAYADQTKVKTRRKMAKESKRRNRV